MTPRSSPSSSAASRSGQEGLHHDLSRTRLFGLVPLLPREVEAAQAAHHLLVQRVPPTESRTVRRPVTLRYPDVVRPPNGASLPGRAVMSKTTSIEWCDSAVNPVM